MTIILIANVCNFDITRMQETGNDLPYLAYVYTVMDWVSIKQNDEIPLVTMDFHRIGSRRSPQQAKNENMQGNCVLLTCKYVSL